MSIRTRAHNERYRTRHGLCAKCIHEPVAYTCEYSPSIQKSLFYESLAPPGADSQPLHEIHTHVITPARSNTQNTMVRNLQFSPIEGVSRQHRRTPPAIRGAWWSGLMQPCCDSATADPALLVPFAFGPSARRTRRTPSAFGRPRRQTRSTGALRSRVVFSPF